MTWVLLSLLFSIENWGSQKLSVSHWAFHRCYDWEGGTILCCIKLVGTKCRSTSVSMQKKKNSHFPHVLLNALWKCNPGWEWQINNMLGSQTASKQQTRDLYRAVSRLESGYYFYCTEVYGSGIGMHNLPKSKPIPRDSDVLIPSSSISYNLSPSKFCRFNVCDVWLNSLPSFYSHSHHLSHFPIPNPMTHVYQVMLPETQIWLFSLAQKLSTALYCAESNRKCSIHTLPRFATNLTMATATSTFPPN